MDREIAPFSYNGTLYINSSKSYFQRALAISCGHVKSHVIIGFLWLCLLLHLFQNHLSL
ncbi:MAG: hypothetical protein HN564_00245 [Flavobacteriales bacterium]|nr:hypothetical protein [Flavobacteriales bacterium]